MPVHFGGLPVDLDPLYELADKHGLRVIEDAAHAIGTEYKGKRIGAFGDTQVFSFHPNKNMTTGEGGCVVTRNDKLAEKIALLRFHGMDREAWNRFGKSGSQHYEIITPGFKYNMMDIQAALGLHQLPALDSFIKRRTELALRYQKLLADWPQWTHPGTPAFAHRHAWHLYAPLINPAAAGMDRDAFMQGMKQRNIGTGLHYRAAHLYPYYREHYGFKPGDFPNAASATYRACRCSRPERRRPGRAIAAAIVRKEVTTKPYERRFRYTTSGKPAGAVPAWPRCSRSVPYEILHQRRQP
jgi:dTDP-4-amino-4,6-dideoxygalactose transaminase